MHPAIPYLTAAVLFGLGVYGVLTRRNAVLLLMAIELLLNAVNLVLVTADATVRAALPDSGQVFALGRDGSTPWVSPETAAVHLSPTSVAHGTVYTVDPAGFLTARDPATGLISAKLPLGGPSAGGVSAVGGAIYVAVGTGLSQNGSGSIVAFGDTSHSGG